MSVPPSLEVLNEGFRRLWLSLTKKERQEAMNIALRLLGHKPLARWKRYIPLRLRVAWGVLRGNPTIYRVGFQETVNFGLPVKARRLGVFSCRFEPAPGEKFKDLWRP